MHIGKSGKISRKKSFPGSGKLFINGFILSDDTITNDTIAADYLMAKRVKTVYLSLIF